MPYMLPENKQKGEEMKFVLLDNSVWEMSHPIWLEAWDMKRGTPEGFAKACLRAWLGAGEPAKFNHAYFAGDVMYRFLRAAIMGIALSEETGGKSRVVGLQEDGGIVEYPLRR